MALSALAVKTYPSVISGGLGGVLSFKELAQKDPTRTITLRKKFIVDITRRYSELKRAIKKSVVDNDCFGLKDPVFGIPLILEDLTPIEQQKFKYLRDDQKVQGFMDWLDEQEEKGVLEKTIRPSALPVGEEPWSNVYIQSSYQKGMVKGRNELRVAGVNVPTYGPTGESLSAVFNQPFHANRVGLIYTRCFDQLKGVTRAMDGQISRVLARGLAEGRGVLDIARNINDRVDKIGVNRSRLIARTEIVQTHNEASLAEYEAAERLVEEPILVQWWSALDEVVRPTHGTHGGRHGKVFTRKEGQALLGEPNCRCSLLPYIESVHGPKGTARKRAIEKHGKGLAPKQEKKG